MNILNPVVAVSPLRQRLLDEMEIRRFGRETQRNYIRDVGRFATFLGRSPDTATTEDVRRFQVEQRELGVPVPTMNNIVSALRFFFIQTLDRRVMADREAVDQPRPDGVDAIDAAEIDAGDVAGYPVEPIRQVAEPRQRQIAGEAERTAVLLEIRHTVHRRLLWAKPRPAARR